MKDELISFETAKLAKEKGFNVEQINFYNSTSCINKDENDFFVPRFEAPSQSLLQRWIRETRGVHIDIQANASGYYWGMSKSKGGTDLGYSLMSGPNHGGAWNTFEEALENALKIQLSYDLPDDTSIIKHWSNYSSFAIKSNKKLKVFK